jgi:hypothetical protein
MPMTQLTLDLGTFVTAIKYLLATFLLAICVFTFVIPWIRDLLTKEAEAVANPRASGLPRFRRRDENHCSDTPPPAGFADHLKIIEATAPNADPKIWWEYAKAEMTEAEVAIAEAKLARVCNETVTAVVPGGTI